MGWRVEAIGRVEGGRAEPVDDAWGRSRALIALDPARFGPEALLGLNDFSHAEIVFLFHRRKASTRCAKARRPRGNPAWPEVGIFAQRGSGRPNRIGVSVCNIVAVRGLALEVEGLDAIAGSPVLDIKPVMSGFLPRGPLREPAWAGEIMREYW